MQSPDNSSPQVIASQANVAIPSPFDTPSLAAINSRASSWQLPVANEQQQQQQVPMSSLQHVMNSHFSVAQSPNLAPPTSSATPLPFDNNMTSSLTSSLPPIASFPSLMSLDCLDLQNNSLAFLMSQDSLLGQSGSVDSSGGDPLMIDIPPTQDDDQSQLTFDASDLPQNMFNPTQ